MRYLPHTPEEIKDMLDCIGLSDLDGLFDDVPDRYRVEELLRLPAPLDEWSLQQHLETLAEQNCGARMASFLGGGAYAHHVPCAVDQLLLRGEFYTAYTPYQPEVAQGTLQSIFEFQTTACELFGMDVSNASMYDGASALAEAALMAIRVTGRSRVVASAGLHPEYLETVKTYLPEARSLPQAKGTSLELVALTDAGTTDMGSLRDSLREPPAAFLVGYPNVYGCVEDLRPLREVAKECGALFITCTAEPYALSLLAPPGACGADIAVGEGQAIASPPQFGGPGVGLFTCQRQYMQKMPGRVVGRTVDASGAPAFTLTLATREQHIRRERATSNICTNHALVALAFTIHAALLGRRGFQRIGELCLNHSEYLKQRLAEIEGVSLPFSAPTFNEFVVRLPNDVSADAIVKEGQKANILLGIPLSRMGATDLSAKLATPQDLLVAVTELHGKDTLDRYTHLFEESLATVRRQQRQE